MIKEILTKIEGNKTLSGIVVSVASTLIIFFFQNDKQGTECKFVKSEKAYFYQSFDGEPTPSYVLKGEKINVEKEENGYSYAEYKNSRGVTTKGWLKKSDLK